MKNNKWIWRTLTIVLTLVILAGVGGAGYRMGMIQGANISQNTDEAIPFFNHTSRFNGNFDERPGAPHLQGFARLHMREFDHGFSRGMGRGGFAPLFGLVQLAVLGLLLWAGYKLYKKSGWQFVKVNAAGSTPVDEKKE